MNNRYFKTFICVLMISCLLFSFTFQAHATFPGQVGEFGGAIASIIAGAMGIDFDYREMSIQSINELLGIVSDLNHKIWVIRQAAGMTALGIAKDGYDAIAQYVKDLVTDKNIQSNTSGSIWSGSEYVFDGYKLSGTYPNNRPGCPIGSVVTISQSAGQTFTLGDSNYWITVEGIGNNIKVVKMYAHGELVYTNDHWGGTEPINAQAWFGLNDQGKVQFGLCNLKFNYFNAGSAIVGDVTEKQESWAYRAGTIDTTVGDNLPSTGGMVITFPNTETGSIDDLLGILSAQVLSNATDYIDTEFVNDIGEPVVTDQTIADTPWTDLAGTLDQIKAYLQNLHINVQGHISSALDSIVDGVGEITEDVALGTTSTVKAYIDNFIELYLPWIQEIGSHGSIWHYVVSWIGSISSCFSWSLSALSSCGATFLAPIYAAFAGAVVIAIYRRFGR